MDPSSSFNICPESGIPHSSTLSVVVVVGSFDLVGYNFTQTGLLSFKRVFTLLLTHSAHPTHHIAQTRKYSRGFLDKQYEMQLISYAS